MKYIQRHNIGKNQILGQHKEHTGNNYSFWKMASIQRFTEKLLGAGNNLLGMRYKNKQEVVFRELLV